MSILETKNSSRVKKLTGVTGAVLISAVVAISIGLGTSGGSNSPAAGTCLSKAGSPSEVIPFACPTSASSTATSSHQFQQIPVVSSSSSTPVGSVLTNFSQPVSGADASFTTEVVTRRGDSTLYIYGGQLGSAPTQGTLYIVSVSGDVDQSASYFPTPSASGEVTLTGLNSGSVSLTTTGGESYQFNIQTLSY